MVKNNTAKDELRYWYNNRHARWRCRIALDECDNGTVLVLVLMLEVIEWVKDVYGMEVYQSYGRRGIRTIVLGVMARWHSRLNCTVGIPCIAWEGSLLFSACATVILILLVLSIVGVVEEQELVLFWSFGNSSRRSAGLVSRYKCQRSCTKWVVWTSLVKMAAVYSRSCGEVVNINDSSGQA